MRLRRSRSSSAASNDVTTGGDSSQTWFLTDPWQASILRSIAQIEAGEGVRFESSAEFLEALGDE
jgi:hypothetical protein